MFFLSLERQREKTRRHWRRDRTESEGGWQGVSESAVRDKPLVVYGLARNRRGPKRPSEPRPSGAQPEETKVGKRWRSLPYENDGWLLGIRYSVNAVRMATSLDSKKERSCFERAATATRATLGMRRITLMPRRGQSNAVSVSVRKVPEPSLSCFSRYFCALTKTTSWDFSATSTCFKKSVRQDSLLP